MELIDFITVKMPMSSAKAEEIKSCFRKEFIKRDDFLILEGKKGKAFYIQSGIARSFTANAMGNEVTVRFFSAPSFLNDYLSFFNQTPARQNYQALTDLTVWSMDFEMLQRCFHGIYEFRELGRLLLAESHTAVEDRLLDIVQRTAEERYVELIEKSPEIIKYVSLKVIASYLGITDSSLSRIRREFLQAKK